MLSLRESLVRPRVLVLMGLLIREALSFWTGHPYDLEVWVRNAYYVGHGQNPYTAFFPPVPGLSFAYLQQTLPGVGYLPIWPSVVAGFYHVYAALPFSRFFLYFLIKQPTVLADTYLGVLIFRMIQQWGGTREAGVRALRYWTFFPYAIVISAVWGQFDALVVVLLIMFLLSASPTRRVLFLGLGIALKWFPLVFVPYEALRARGLRKALAFLSLAIPAGLTLLIFQGMGWDYLGVTQMSASASHGGGAGMSYVNILQAPALIPLLTRVPFLYSVLGYLWVPGILVGAYLAQRRFASDPRGTVQAILLVTTTFYLTRWGVYEQYLMYLFPLLIVDIELWHPERRPLFRLLLLLATAYLLVNNDFLVRFLGPLSSGFVDLSYAADSSPDLGIIRAGATYFLNVVITITFVQLALVFADPTRGSRPWPQEWLAKIQGWMRPQAADSDTNVREPLP